MVGLLFKDFVGLKGARIVTILLIATLSFGVLRFAFPGDHIPVENEVRLDEEGALVSGGDLVDLALVVLPLIMVTCATMLLSVWTVAICRNDEANKTHQYTKALPLTKNTYVASKYIFLAIAVYAMYSLEIVWITIYNSCAKLPYGLEIISLLSLLLPMFASFSLLMASVELPFFLIFGTKKGSIIKTALVCLFFYLIIAFALFGDLQMIDRFDLDFLLDWSQENAFLLSMETAMLPVVCGILYWISYKITIKIYRTREVCIND